MEISAAQVKAFRDKTGLPMMECKKALVEAGGDENEALELLKKAGLLKVAKMSDREASEGRISIAEHAGRIGMAELRCETEPVAGTAEFVQIANYAARFAAESDDPTVDGVLAHALPDRPGTLGDMLQEVFNRIRENMKLHRVFSAKGPAGTYLHHNAKVGVIAELTAECPEVLRKGLCMHIASMKPAALRREEVPAGDTAAARERFAAEAAGKPPAVAEKMVDGKLSRWYSEFVLLEQPYVLDDKISVDQALKQADPKLTVTRYTRYEVGVA